jgi:hypothetical protein
VFAMCNQLCVCSRMSAREAVVLTVLTAPSRVGEHRQQGGKLQKQGSSQHCRAAPQASGSQHRMREKPAHDSNQPTSCPGDTFAMQCSTLRDTTLYLQISSWFSTMNLRMIFSSRLRCPKLLRRHSSPAVLARATSSRTWRVQCMQYNPAHTSNSTHMDMDVWLRRAANRCMIKRLRERQAAV